MEWMAVGLFFVLGGEWHEIREPVVKPVVKVEKCVTIYRADLKEYYSHTYNGPPFAYKEVEVGCPWGGK